MSSDHGLNRSTSLKWSLHERQPAGCHLKTAQVVIQRQSADPAWPISSASGRQQPVTTQI